MNVPMAQPVLGPEELAAVKEVLDSGQLSLGPRVPAFEAAFAARVGAKHACAVSSGTAGLHLGLRAAGVEAGDEVITSPFSFIASANVILYERATPVFVDIDPDTLCAPADAIAAAVTERTRAILPVSIFGKRCEIPDVGLPIVEDACEALGSVSGRGHSTVFAFYPNKQMTTGEGGVLATDDDRVKERVDSERNQGRAPNMDWLDHDRLGFNYRLTDIACAIGLVQLDRLDDRWRWHRSSASTGSTGCSRTAGASPRSTTRHCATSRWRRSTTTARGSSTSSGSRAATTATTPSARSATRASRPSPTSPPSPRPRGRARTPTPRAPARRGG